MPQRQRDFSLSQRHTTSHVTTQYRNKSNIYIHIIAHFILFQKHVHFRQATASSQRKHVPFHPNHLTVNIHNKQQQSQQNIDMIYCNGRTTQLFLSQKHTTK